MPDAIVFSAETIEAIRLTNPTYVGCPDSRNLDTQRLGEGPQLRSQLSFMHEEREEERMRRGGRKEQEP